MRARFDWLVVLILLLLVPASIRLALLWSSSASMPREPGVYRVLDRVPVGKLSQPRELEQEGADQAAYAIDMSGLREFVASDRSVERVDEESLREAVAEGDPFLGTR